MDDKIFRFVVRFKQENDGLSPTLRTIADACGLARTETVARHLHTLEEAGRIDLERTGIRVVGGRWSLGGA